MTFRPMKIAQTMILFLTSVLQFNGGQQTNNSSFNLPFSYKGDTTPILSGSSTTQLLPRKLEEYYFFRGAFGNTEKLAGFNMEENYTISNMIKKKIRIYQEDLALSTNLEMNKESFGDGLPNSMLLTTINKTKRNEPILTSTLNNILNIMQQHLDHGSGSVSRQISSMSFPSIEAALLSLAFLTFAVFLIDLVQDLLRGSSTGRKRRSDEGVDDSMTDLIVLTLSSIDTISFGSQNPSCGQKLLCHLNRSGWHDGILGTASNYFVSLILSLFSPKSGFQNNLDAAQFGRKSDDCTARYSGCPSVLADLLPS